MTENKLHSKIKKPVVEWFSYSVSLTKTQNLSQSIKFSNLCFFVFFFKTKIITASLKLFPLLQFMTADIFLLSELLNACQLLHWYVLKYFNPLLTKEPLTSHSQRSTQTDQTTYLDNFDNNLDKIYFEQQTKQNTNNKDIESGGSKIRTLCAILKHVITITLNDFVFNLNFIRALWY